MNLNQMVMNAPQMTGPLANLMTMLGDLAGKLSPAALTNLTGLLANLGDKLTPEMMKDLGNFLKNLDAAGKLEKFANNLELLQSLQAQLNASGTLKNKNF